MKVYLVNRHDYENDYSSTIEKAFSTLEKAQAYKVELEDKYKDSVTFKFRYFYFDIEEVEVE